MSIKVVCNICNKDIESGFLFEAAIMELIPNTDNQQKKTVIHACKDCYDNKFKEIIYGKNNSTK